MKKLFILVLTLVFSSTMFAQIDLKYQVPSKEILELADAAPAPSMRINNSGDTIVLLKRQNYKNIDELSQTEMRLAGLRINPVTNISSRETYLYNISIMKVGDKDAVQVTGLPEKMNLSNFGWSPDEKKMAFTNTVQSGVELWILDIESASAKRITDPVLNANMGFPYTWFHDSESLLVHFIPEDKKPLIDKAQAVPTGPTVSVNDGKKAQNRTYQDLLKDKADEFNFEQLVISTLKKVGIDGTVTQWKDSSMISDVSFSPDGNYVLVTEIQKPFSYLVPLSRFPSVTAIYTKDGKKIKDILKVPLIEDLPKGFMAVRKGMRSLRWRNDKPATLFWAEALDDGDPEKEVTHRDEVFQLAAPFTGSPQSMFKTINRFYTVIWGNDEIAVAMDYWWNTRNLKTYMFNPSKSGDIKVVYDRNYQDRYNDPGSFVTEKNSFGKNILVIDNNTMYLQGEGYSPEGKKPFIDSFDIATYKTERLWQAENTTHLESIMLTLDMIKGDVLTRIESKNEYPNYYIRNIKSTSDPTQITFFKNPFESIRSVHKEVIKYKRDDGVDLSATLYLPVGYDTEKKEKCPMIMWAYPAEFKDKDSAGQVTASDNEFTYPWYGSPIYWVTKGYVVLDDASFPIIGEKDEEPNDTFITQLVANAKAAIDAVDALGYIDRTKVAVGGHSYGAFMTANLLTHCDLFAAGIARSGAYNRTLTPFGFQSEERNYWEAPEVYYEMSPFMHADKMKSHLLLIHGGADNNSGTYTMQSERYFNALKGLGATVRLVILPKESHGYRARESILHMLWEQDQWLEKYLKN